MRRDKTHRNLPSGLDVQPSANLNTAYASTAPGRALMVEYAWFSSTVPPAGITMPLLGAVLCILPVACGTGLSRTGHRRIVLQKECSGWLLPCNPVISIPLQGNYCSMASASASKPKISPYHASKRSG